MTKNYYSADISGQKIHRLTALYPTDHVYSAAQATPYEPGHTHKQKTADWLGLQLCFDFYVILISSGFI